jgi:hypothetical protein
MSRCARILYQVADYQGRLWDVREERDTSHGWPLLMGWPVDTPRGPGGGAPRVIMTKELKEYLDDMRYDCKYIILPISKTVRTRLRRLLGHHRYRDRPRWWLARIEDLKNLSLEKFCRKHSCSTGAASQARSRLLSPLKKI